MLSWPLTGEGHESPEAIAAIVGDGGVRRAISGVSLPIRFTRKLQTAGPQWTRRSKHTHTHAIQGEDVESWSVQQIYRF